MRKLNENHNTKSIETSKSRTKSTNNNDVVIYNAKKTWNDLTSQTNIIKTKIPSNNNTKTESYQFKVKTESLQKKNQDLTNDEKNIVKNVIVSNLKQNKMTPGTQKMMENEKFHANEAIESGIYVTWSTKKNNQNIDCFRLGSKSMCICKHYFAEHEKILTSKKFSSKCKTCSCKSFAFIPTLPEEVGEYWIPHQKNFSYGSYFVKCKCKHPWTDHSADKFLKCKTCNCYSFNSNFCCVVCNQFWEDHTNTYETEKERKDANKPILNDFIPLIELPEVFNAVYKKQIGDDI